MFAARFRKIFLQQVSRHPLWRLRVSAACFPSFFKSRSNVSRSVFERTLTASSIAPACSRKPRIISARPFGVSSTWRTRRSSAWSLRETSPFLTSRSTATLIEPGVSQTLGPIVFTGSGPLWRSASRTRKSESPSSVRLMLSAACGNSAWKAFMKTSQTCTPEESCFSVVALRFIEMVSWRQLYLCQYILTQTNDTNMKIYLFTLLCFVAYLPANAEDKSTDKKENMNNYKKDVPLWYEAFTKKDAALLDKILHETWVDIPSPPGTAPGTCRR